MKCTTKIKYLIPLALMLSVFFIRPALAIESKDLTLTNFSGGVGNSERYTGGLWFNGIDGYLTRSGFAPLHNIGQYSIVVWVVPDTIVGTDMIISQRVSSSNVIGIQRTGDEFQAFDYNGGTNWVINSGTIEADKLYCVGLVWDKNGDDKGHLYVNDTEYISVGTKDGNTWCNTDMDIGRRTDGDYYWEGNMSSLLIDRENAYSDANMTTLFNAGPDYAFDISTYLYTFDETSGNTAYDVEFWKDAQETSFDVDTPAWYLAQTTLFNVRLSVFEGSLNALVVLLGLIMVPGSTVFLARNRHDMDTDKLFLFLICFFMGFALIVGGLVG
jgi:hypothetical protein